MAIPPADPPGLQNVIRGYMSESFWMDWSNVPEGKKKVLCQKVGGSTTTLLDDRFKIGQVYNDPRIPIIQRYENHWATREAAQRTASGWRKDAYSCGEATPPSKYAYNAANSAKRNPAAPRGRWDSVSQSVKHEGKGKKAQRTKKRAQAVRTASPEPPDQGDRNAVDVSATNTRPLPHPTPGPSESQNASPRQINPEGNSSWPSLQPGLGHVGGDLVGSSGMRNIVTGPRS
jgi:hypothetical protein